MIILYVLEDCPYCNRALSILDEYKLKYTKIIVENNETSKKIYKKQNKMRTFPQIFMQIEEDKFVKIGGCSELEESIDSCQLIKSSNIAVDIIYKMYYNLFSKK